MASGLGSQIQPVTWILFAILVPPLKYRVLSVGYHLSDGSPVSGPNPNFRVPGLESRLPPKISGLGFHPLDIGTNVKKVNFSKTVNNI